MIGAQSKIRSFNQMHKKLASANFFQAIFQLVLLVI